VRLDDFMLSFAAQWRASQLAAGKQRARAGQLCPGIEHSRHRSPSNFVVHLIAGLIAYSHQDKKPSLHLDERALLAA